MANRPTDEQLALVAHHGSGPIERALATVRLARRRERDDELRRLVEEVANDDNGVMDDSGV